MPIDKMSLSIYIFLLFVWCIKSTSYLTFTSLKTKWIKSDHTLGRWESSTSIDIQVDQGRLDTRLDASKRRPIGACQKEKSSIN